MADGSEREAGPAHPDNAWQMAGVGELPRMGGLRTARPMKSECTELNTDSSLEGGGSLAASLETRGPARDALARLETRAPARDTHPQLDS